MHFWALCKKRFIYFKRDYKGVFCEIVLPIVIITLGLCFTLISLIKDPIPKDYLPKEYFTKDVKVWVNVPQAQASTYNDIYNRIANVEKYAISKRIDTNSP